MEANARRRRPSEEDRLQLAFRLCHARCHAVATVDVRTFLRNFVKVRNHSTNRSFANRKHLHSHLVISLSCC
jgi:hypothetical protein